jgi:3-oxoacyl-[acyl-carrier-protein] synthase-1
MIPLFVKGLGAVTAVGLDAPRTFASLRGGMDGLVETPFAGVMGQDLRVAPVRGYAEGVLGRQRFKALAARALSECLSSLGDTTATPLPVFLGLPIADRPGVDEDLEPYLCDRLERHCAMPRGTIQAISSGRTAVFAALRKAEDALNGGVETCIVGGVDSLLDPFDLRHFSKRGDLAEEYDGYRPGEGACFVALSRRVNFGFWGRKPAAILGIGEALETASGSSQAPLVGAGMATAMRTALSDARAAESAIGLFVNAVNGTRREFEDEAHARIRLLRTPRAELATWHVASFLGETGAAYGALALLWASSALELDVSTAPGVLLSAAQGPMRAAVFLQRPARDAWTQHEAPAISVWEPAVHGVSRIGSTHTIDGDPGIRLSGIDDRHRHLAERDFDELASLMMLRQGHLDSSSAWTDIADFERRALAHLDALAWSGDAARELAKAAAEGEPEEAGSAVLVLCSAAPRGDEIDVLLRACAQSEEHRAYVASHAALAARRSAEPLLHRLLEVDGESAREALRGLTVAGWLTPDWIMKIAPRFAVPCEEFVVACGALGVADYGRGAARWLMSLEGPLPTEVTLAALTLEPASTWLSQMPTAQLIERAPEAAALVALQNGESLWSKLGADPLPTSGAMIALGWSGETDATPLLLAGLDEDEAVAEEAARALARIYGVHPLETIERPASGEDEGSTTAPDQPVDHVDRLSLDRTQWSTLLQSRAVRPSERLRAGKKWGKYAARESFGHDETACTDRTVLFWEHALMNGQRIPVHPRQWVAAQRRLLGA